VGGAVGSRVGQGETRVVATVIGTVIGAVIGAQVGRNMDGDDRACAGHSLELVESSRAVQWVNHAPA
jgi:outer membrane lipoprotein SlyB